MFGLEPEIAAVVGASAVVGTPLIFNFLKELWFDYRKRKEERAYISVQLVFLLDRFVAQCADVAWDRGYAPTEPEPDDEFLVDQTQIPTFDLSSVKGEYKYLKPQILARLHTIEIKLNQARDALTNEDANWHYSDGSNWAFYETRREQYGKVGLFATTISKDLKIKFKLKNTENWEPSERILRSIEDLNEIKEYREENKRQRKIERAKKTQQENTEL